MRAPRFTIRWLLFEIALLSLALALYLRRPEYVLDWMAGYAAATICTGAAVGGLIGYFKSGALVGAILFVIGCWLHVWPFQHWDAGG
jgi:hypothetical protein